MTDRKQAARRKLLSIIPRTTLEKLIDSEKQPWHMPHTALIEAAILEWDGEAVAKAINDIQRTAE